jgi:hypothetical protein
MKLRERLALLAGVIADEAEHNGGFRRRLEVVMASSQRDPSVIRDNIAATNASRKGGRRTPALVDPLSLARQSEAALRKELSNLGIEQLKDVVAQYGMDPGKLVMKWKESARIIDRIVELALARSTKGNAFRADRPATASGSVSRGRFEEQKLRGKTEKMPYLLFDFSDLSDHENLGAVGFRNLQSKLELLISGTIRNVGTTLATDIKLDIYHFKSSKALPIHEISDIRILDVLPASDTFQWSKSIRLADLTVDGPYYQSGPTGVFSDDPNDKYYHYHVVFSCKNLHGEEFSTIYCAEKVVEHNVFKGNRMMLFSHSGKYDPVAQFPKEWRDEIAAREL